jgi:hypothetical protein
MRCAGCMAVVMLLSDMQLHIDVITLLSNIRLYIRLNCYIKLTWLFERVCSMRETTAVTATVSRRCQSVDIATGALGDHHVVSNAHSLLRAAYD